MKIFFEILFCLVILSLTNSDNINQSSSSDISAQYFYYRMISNPYYTKIRTNFSTIPEYSKINDLQFTFNHPTPLLYELQFQGSCSSLIRNYQSLIRFKYDNRSFTNNLELSSPIEGIVTSCSKFDRTYFPAGSHTVDVEIQTFGGIKIFFGELYIKLTQFNPTSQTNLQLPNWKH